VKNENRFQVSMEKNIYKVNTWHLILDMTRAMYILLALMHSRLSAVWGGGEISWLF
jgi:hypothetical protein